MCVTYGYGQIAFGVLLLGVVTVTVWICQLACSSHAFSERLLLCYVWGAAADAGNAQKLLHNIAA
jgi:hypothetical protein